mgnify:CR=1 FL=1
MNTRSRLFLMMVLEFFIWGAWLPLIFGYLPSLGFSAGDWYYNAIGGGTYAPPAVTIAAPGGKLSTVNLPNATLWSRRP